MSFYVNVCRSFAGQAKIHFETSKCQNDICQKFTRANRNFQCFRRVNNNRNIIHTFISAECNSYVEQTSKALYCKLITNALLSLNTNFIYHRLSRVVKYTLGLTLQPPEIINNLLAKIYINNDLSVTLGGNFKVFLKISTISRRT